MLWLTIDYRNYDQGYIMYNCPHCGTSYGAINSASTHCFKCTKSLPDVIKLTEPLFAWYKIAWHKAPKGTHRIK